MAPPYPPQAPGGQRKVVLLPVTPGDKAGEVGSQWSQLLWSWGCHTAKASCRTGQGIANTTPLVFGVFKGQGQNKPPEEKPSTRAGTELRVEPGELAGY